MGRVLAAVATGAVVVAGLALASPVLPAAGRGTGCTGDVVVSVGAKLRGEGGALAKAVHLSQPLEPATYRVTTSSSDQRDDAAPAQVHEQWTVNLVAADRTWTLGPTRDLPDDRPDVVVGDDLGVVEVTAPVASVVARHAFPGQGANSVVAECVGLTLVAPPEPEPPAPEPPGPEPPEPEPPAPEPPDPEPPASEPPGPVPPGSELPGPEPPGSEPPGPDPSAPEPPAAGPPGPEPAAVDIDSAASVDCGSGSLSVELVNAGDAPVTVDVAVPRNAVAPAVAVPAGATTSTSVPLGADTENQTLAIRVVDSQTGERYAEAEVTIDCLAAARPAASISVDCQSDQILVDLENPGQESTRVSVISERGSVEVTTLASGESRTVAVPTAGRLGVGLLVVDGDGGTIADELVPIRCARPEWESDVEVDCARGQAVVALANEGDADGRAVVGLGSRSETVEVGAGTSRVVELALPDQAFDSTSVTVGDDAGTIAEVDLASACVEPRADLDATCSALVLALGNDGRGTARFAVDVLVRGVPALSRQVPVADEVEVDLGPPPPGPWAVRVTEGSRGGLVGDYAADLECERTRAEITVDCHGGTVEVDVAGAPGARSSVLVDGAITGRPVVLGPEGREVATVPLPRGSTKVEVLDSTSSRPVAFADTECGASGGDTGKRAAGAIAFAAVAVSAAGVYARRPG